MLTSPYPTQCSQEVAVLRPDEFSLNGRKSGQVKCISVSVIDPLRAAWLLGFKLLTDAVSPFAFHDADS